MKFHVGDQVAPRATWRKLMRRFPGIVPSGKVRAIAPWGGDQVLYVGRDPRPFAAYVFKLSRRRAKKQCVSRELQAFNIR